ncbi:MAG: mechanosensitive ion channel [Ignavibacteria bacterium]|nr:mechanosensitive ion channel [Ignavibacteria bacterium]
MWKDLKNIFYEIREYLNIPITTISKTEITLWTIVYFIFLTFLLFYITSKLRKWIVYKVLAKSRIDLGVRVAVGTIFRYIILVIGLIIVLQTVGIDLSTVTILAGALGIGIGFGLQNITSNFVSGIIILFERPIKVGDRIEVGKVSGDVVRISMRSTTIVTNDNISVIVPNSDFISSTVINWSHMDRNVRLNFPVGVSYRENPENIKKILLEVAVENEGVLREPKPDVLFSDFGESYLEFNLRIWTREYINRPGVLKSQLYYAIFKKFRETGIEIPYPHRDIILRNLDDIKKQLKSTDDSN